MNMIIMKLMVEFLEGKYMNGLVLDGDESMIKIFEGVGYMGNCLNVLFYIECDLIVFDT